MPNNFLRVILLWCLCLMTSCTPMRDRPYTLPNPILVAFKHQIDLQPLRDTMAKDSTLRIQEIDDGFVLYAAEEQRESRFFRLWINDDFLVYQLESMPYLPMPYNNCLAGRVILEAEFRKTYPVLATNTKESFSERSVFMDRHYGAERSFHGNDYPRAVPLRIKKELLQPVDTFQWKSNAFGSQDAYHFRKGILDGPFQSFKATGLRQTGFFRHGVEAGIWQYHNSQGQLQYIEEYSTKGVLKKVVHQKGNTFSRSAPKPTLKQLKLIHQIMLLVLILLGMYILYQYYKALQNFKQPYKGQKLVEILGGVLISPFLSFCGGIAILFLSVFLANIFKPVFNWDLPIDFLESLPAVMLFVMVECLFLLISNRLNDVLWHVLLMVLGILIYQEWRLLLRLETCF